jgi:hypothetical protein
MASFAFVVLNPLSIVLTIYRCQGHIRLQYGHQRDQEFSRTGRLKTVRSLKKKPENVTPKSGQKMAKQSKMVGLRGLEPRTDGL